MVLTNTIISNWNIGTNPCISLAWVNCWLWALDRLIEVDVHLLQATKQPIFKCSRDTELWLSSWVSEQWKFDQIVDCLEKLFFQCCIPILEWVLRHSERNQHWHGMPPELTIKQTRLGKLELSLILYHDKTKQTIVMQLIYTKYHHFKHIHPIHVATIKKHWH